MFKSFGFFSLCFALCGFSVSLIQTLISSKKWISNHLKICLQRKVFQETIKLSCVEGMTSGTEHRAHDTNCKTSWVR